jgi:F-type H+-transporting ATPase subunit b
VEMISKILEVLEINSFVFLQMALVVILSFLTGKFLIKPIIRTFEERDNRTTVPMEKAREMLQEAEVKASEHEDRLKAANQESITRKRARIEEVVKSERRLIEEARSGAEKSIEEVKERISAEKDEALTLLREESQAIAKTIVEKMLGRSIA